MCSSKIAVIMLTMNQREKTIRCLSSFRDITDPPYHIVLWDNGSHDGTAETVHEMFPEVLVHHSPTNLGVASGRNAAAALAIKTFAPLHLLFIDNDMVVTSDFMSALLAPFNKRDEKLAQTSAKIKFLGDTQRLYSVGGSNIKFWLGKTTPIGYEEIDHGQYDHPMKCIVQGGATLFRADVFQELGGFDSTFDPYGFEDLDFSLRAYRAGYYGLYVPQAVVFHETSHTFESGQYTEKYARYKTRHWFVFMRRHASLAQQLGFYFLGAPYILARIVIREGRKGNIKALKGVVCGMLDFRKALHKRKTKSPQPPRIAG